MSGLIPQSFIDDIVARTDIVDIVAECIPLKKTGKNHQACCPFHQEKTPSFTVNADKQFYYCFGCGASGNVIGFFMRFHKVDFPEAIERLAKKWGLTVPTEMMKSGGKTTSESKANKLLALCEEAAVFYQKNFESHATKTLAQNYLRERGLSLEVVRHFGIGFAPEGWSNFIDYVSGRYSEDALEKSGLAVRHETRASFYDRFRKRIMFPIRDLRGRVIGFGGRALGDERPKYLNSPETPFFHKGRELYGLYEAMKDSANLERLVVVEGYMDVVALHQHGIHNAVATLGTSTTDNHVNRLFKHCKEIVFCFDGDEAGRKAAWRALETVLPEMRDGRKVRFLFLPEGEDPDSLVSREGKTAFLQLLRQEAITLDEYLFESLESGQEMHTLDGRACFARAARDYIQQVPEGAYRALLALEVAKRAELDGSLVNSLMSATAESLDKKAHAATTVRRADPASCYGSGSGAWPANDSYTSAEPLRINPAKMVMRILLKNPRLHKKIAPDLIADDMSDDARLLVVLIRFLEKSPAQSEIAIRGSWHNTPLGERMAEIQRLDIPEGDPEQMLDHAFAVLLARIKKKKLSSLKGRARLKAAVDSMKTARENGRIEK